MLENTQAFGAETEGAKVGLAGKSPAPNKCGALRRSAARLAIHQALKGGGRSNA
jgi:hypothetical protein